MTLCDIANYVLQDICGQEDMQFAFEGLVSRGGQAGHRRPRRPGHPERPVLHRRGARLAGPAPVGAARDERAGRVHRAGADPVLDGPGTHPRRDHRACAAMQARGPTPGSARLRRGPGRSQPTVRAGRSDQAQRQPSRAGRPHREAPPRRRHSAAAGAIQSPTPRTGGTTSRSSVAGSRKKAVESELGALGRHLRKGRLISTWEARHIPARALSAIAEDIAKGVLIDTAVERAGVNLPTRAAVN